MNNISSQELTILCLGTLRYAIERRSATSHDVSRLLIKLKSELPEWAKKQIIADIDYHKPHMDSDSIKEWSKLADELIE